MTADDVKRALARRHPSVMGEWLYATEWNQVDAFALRCWTSGIGCRRVAYEVKVSMGDYRAELAKPRKRAWAVSVSHQFWFAMPADLARQVKASGSLPLECGLIAVYQRNGFLDCRSLVKAPVRVVAPLAETSVASLVRHLADPPVVRHALAEREQRRRALADERRRREAAEDARDRAFLALARARRGDAVPGTVWERGGWGRIRVASPPRLDGRGRAILVDVERWDGRRGEWERGREPVDLGRMLVEYDRLPDAEAA